MGAKRQNPGFQLIRMRLENQDLPVSDLEHIDHWQNIEFSLLCLEDEQFKPILQDAERRAKLKEERKQIDKRQDEWTRLTEENLDENVKNEIRQDKFISEMEAQFASGNFDNVKQLLKQYD